MEIRQIKGHPGEGLLFNDGVRGGIRIIISTNDSKRKLTWLEVTERGYMSIATYSYSFGRWPPSYSENLLQLQNSSLSEKNT